MALFGSYVKHYRTETGLTLRRLAELIGVDPSYMSRLERDEITTPSEEVLDNLAGALNRPRTELYLAAGRITPELAALLERGLPISIQQIAKDLDSITSGMEFHLEKLGYYPEVEDLALGDDPELRNLVTVAPKYMAELVNAVLHDDISTEQFAHAIESVRQMKMALLSRPYQRETP